MSIFGSDYFPAIPAISFSVKCWRTMSKVFLFGLIPGKGSWGESVKVGEVKSYKFGVYRAINTAYCFLVGSSGKNGHNNTWRILKDIQHL